MGDNADNPGIVLNSTAVADLAYMWAPQFTTDAQTASIFWNTHYANIYYYNAVLNGIDNASGGTAADKKRLKAEALLGRALEYLYLVNLYAKPYDSATADKDLAVPFVTSIDVSKTSPARSTVKAMYDQIVADINAAIPDLPEDNVNNRFRGSVPAAYSVLARTYLWMGDFRDAEQNAQTALSKTTDTLVDYNSLTGDAGIINLITRPDALYARFSTSNSYIETPSLAFLQSFDSADLRLRFFYNNLGSFSFTKRGSTQFLPYGVHYGKAYQNTATTIAEMKLIIAEAEARIGTLSTALQALNEVRKCRIMTALFKPCQTNSRDSLLQKVMDERSFEFAFNGLHWFDMRRLDKEGKMPAVNRYDGGGNIIATLPPHGARYILQIPSQVIYYNSDMPQNP